VSDATVAAAGDRPVARVRAVPAWVWLAGLVALSALVRYAFARRVVAPWIMGDEFIYSELAKSVAAHGEFRIRDVPVGAAFSALYPVVIAPAFALFERVPSAYAAAKAINAFVFSLAAVPTYLLARRMVRPGLALAAALLAVAVPGGLYTGMLMTENVFYPLVALAALALVLALERPDPLRVGGALLAIGAAFLARAQAVVLVPVLLTAPLVLVAFERSGRRGLARFRWLYGIPAAALVLLLLAQLARGASPGGLLGAYVTVLEEQYHLREVARWSLWHLAHLDLAAGVIPFAALLLLAAIAHRLGPRERAFVAVAVTLTAWMVLQVGAFASRWALRIEERNLFHVLPLLLVALVVWIERGLPRPPVATAAAAAAAAVLPVLIPFERLVGVSATSDTFGLLVWWDVVDGGVPFARLAPIALALSAALALLFALLPRVAAAPLLPALVLAAFLVMSWSAEGRIRTAAVGALFQGITHEQRDWVDRAVGPDARVAGLWSPHRDPLTMIQNEFFSRAVSGPVYTLGAEMPPALPQVPLVFDEDEGALRDPDGEPVEAEYALADQAVPVAGRVVARDRTMKLVELDGALGYEHWFTGVDPDRWTRGAFEYVRYDCDGGSLRLLVEQDLGLFDGPQLLVARDAAGEIVARRSFRTADRPARWSVPLRPRGGRCALRFTVTPTAVPADELPGNEDDRRLGIRLLEADWRP